MLRVGNVQDMVFICVEITTKPHQQLIEMILKDLHRVQQILKDCERFSNIWRDFKRFYEIWRISRDFNKF